MDTSIELEIGPGPEPGAYVVRVLRSVGGGEPVETITLDVDELVAQRPHVEASILSSSVSARRIMSDTEAAVQEVGVRLFDATFAGDIRTAYRTSAAVAAERGKGVQIALRLDAPGLAALPWEAMFDPETQAYLCLKEPLVRHVPAPFSPPALTITPPLKVLGMISSPAGLPALDVEAERGRLEEALRPHLDAGRVELHWLDDVSWMGVHDKLLEEEWHVLHFIGHGGYDTETDEGVLAFVGRTGRVDYVPASRLADLLDEAEPTPRLVVLNSCQSGASGTVDLFSGTAAALAHSGIHAVAAMQYSISDDAAIAFARGFYKALAHGRGIDEAVRSGRIGILGLSRGTLEWITPVLYLRGEDTRLFDIASMPEERVKAVPPPRRKAWLVAGAIGIVAIGGGVTAALLLRPDTGGPGSGNGQGNGGQPVMTEVTVEVDQPWTDTGISCAAGDTFNIRASGRAWFETENTNSGPDGMLSGEHSDSAVSLSVHPLALIGSLDTVDELFSVGLATTYKCPVGGRLWLGVNDNTPEGNTGDFTAAVTHRPSG
ncbi:CHAT domain-containing protein [Agromyces humi]|uniref:CHAT domain-containing protein n=1 Tax=Agromyces humi TaxID=1766800 RepID=UPI0013597F93|nr:CHAT domain-containing protein [Agromyces humi]